MVDLDFEFRGAKFRRLNYETSFIIFSSFFPQSSSVFLCSFTFTGTQAAAIKHQ